MSGLQQRRRQSTRSVRQGRSRAVQGLVVALAAVLPTTVASAQDAVIDIELIGPTGTVGIGETIDVKVVLRRSGLDSLLPAGHSFMALDLIFGWDPKHVELMGLSQAGAVTLMASYFPSVAADYTGINEANPPKDGDCLYYALAPIGTSVPVTEAGVLVTTFKFKVVGEFVDTFVDVIPQLTVDFTANTVVYDGVVPALPVTGAFTSAVIHQLPPCPADLDGNGQVDGGDLGMLLGVWGTGTGPADFNGDGRVDGSDLGTLLGAWGICAGAGLD